MKTEKVYIEFLLLNAQHGEKSALSDLLPLVRHKMMSYAVRVMRNASDAEDCVQEGMLVVLKKFNKVKDVKAFHGWVYQVINSRCHDHWRYQQRDLRSAVSIDDLAAQSTEPLLHERSDSLFDIKMSMTQLSGVHRSVIYLFYFEGFKVAEIAAILGKPAGTIKSDLFDVRQAIKKFLNQE